MIAAPERTVEVPATPGMRRFSELATIDAQYAAAYFLFSRLRWPEKRLACFGYVVPEGIEKAKLLRTIRSWSHGEQILVKAALDLFDPGCVKANRHQPANLGEAACVLDDGHVQDLFTAIRIVRGDIRLAVRVIDSTHNVISLVPSSGHAAEEALDELIRYGTLEISGRPS